MHNVVFNNIEELVESFVDDNNKGLTVSIITDCNNVDEILKEILLYDDIRISMIDINNEDYSGEYNISMWENNLFIEQCWHPKNEYHEACFYGSENDLFYIDNALAGETELLDKLDGVHLRYTIEGTDDDVEE